MQWRNRHGSERKHKCPTCHARRENTEREHSECHNTPCNNAKCEDSQREVAYRDHTTSLTTLLLLFRIRPKRESQQGNPHNIRGDLFLMDLV